MFARFPLILAALALTAGAAAADGPVRTKKPTTLVMVPAQPAPPPGCLPGWRPARSPLNFQLGCLPTNLTTGQ